jgi:hypothetical protein
VLEQTSESIRFAIDRLTATKEIIDAAITAEISANAQPPVTAAAEPEALPAGPDVPAAETVTPLDPDSVCAACGAPIAAPEHDRDVDGTWAPGTGLAQHDYKPAA